VGQKRDVNGALLRIDPACEPVPSPDPSAKNEYLAQTDKTFLPLREVVWAILNVSVNLGDRVSRQYRLRLHC
jgi:hypothetical protein